MFKEPITLETPLYSSRIIDTYIKLLKRRYSFVDVDEVLEYAGMKAYEVADQGHWFSQAQVDRFHAILLEKTGNQAIAREAGQYAASPEALGVMRQYALGLVGPAKVYERIGMASSRFTKSAVYESRRINANTIEINVTPREGTQEKAFQCENRIGFWDAVARMFDAQLPRIDHPECVFRGDRSCRYIITWENQGSAVWKMARNLSLLVMLLACLVFGMIDLKMALTTMVPISGVVFFILTLIAEFLEKKEIKSILSNLQDNSTELMEQIEANYNNSRLTNEIGETITSLTNIEDVLNKIVQLFRRRLNYDRCLIMLANPENTRLIFRAGYGYTEDKLALLKKSSFHLDRPDAKGVLITCFKEQKPYLISNISEISPRLSSRSLSFSREMGSQSFICCPIICDGKSLGILAVDNVKSKKPLVESDLTMLLGLSHVIGISVRNVELLDARDRQMQSILQTLAASIDARDPLTAGHSSKVTEYAMGICEELNLSKESREAIRVSALLHDYGKIGVPDSILKKPGRLTRDEYEIVKTHAMKSRQILEQINFTDDLSKVPEIAGAHHEKIDGSGYPLGLQGDEIPLGARIIAVADFFEAVTAKRHYRDPLPLEVAFKLLEKERGLHFEAHIVDAFRNFLEKREPTRAVFFQKQALKVS
jgi:HD-GYP domain-containing protein (c-di-GMP phosphodiesterase class II)